MDDSFTGFRLPQSLPYYTPRKEPKARRLHGPALAGTYPTGFLDSSRAWRELGDRLVSSGLERSGLPWINLEDERLVDAGSELPDGLLEV